MARSPEERLSRALKAKAVLTERSKRLEQQLEDFRKREDVMGHIASELVERQRELNFMLHRASSVLHQLQDTNLALSAEFTHLTNELPTPEGSDIETTISKVNELFHKTHELAGEMQDEIFRKTTDAPKVDQNAKTPEADAEEAPVQNTPTKQDNEEALIEAEAEESQMTEAQLAMEDSGEEESIEELFGRARSDEPDLAGKITGSTQKQGILTKLFGRHDGRDK